MVTLSRLLARHWIADETIGLQFARPSGFEFEPGQTVDVTLVDPAETDAEGNTRTFSIASAPHEDHLLFATRVRKSAFKRMLAAAPIGSEVQIDGPTGSFTLHRDVSKPAVLLAGGIGITPFRSMVLDVTERRTSRPVWLFDSNLRPETSAFLGELAEAADSNPAFRFVPTMTEMGDSQRSWSGETGLIDQAMLSRHLSGAQGSIYYVAGPPKMVASMRQMLLESGIEKSAVRAEDFSGY